MNRIASNPPTLQNRQAAIFQAIAAACAGLDAQLVLSLGSHDQRLDPKVTGAAIVVPVRSAA